MSPGLVELYLKRMLGGTLFIVFKNWLTLGGAGGAVPVQKAPGVKAPEYKKYKNTVNPVLGFRASSCYGCSGRAEGSLHEPASDSGILDCPPTAGSAGSAGAIGQKTHTRSKCLLTTPPASSEGLWVVTRSEAPAGSWAGALVTEARVLLSACGHLSRLGGQGLPRALSSRRGVMFSYPKSEGLKFGDGAGRTVAEQSWAGRPILGKIHTPFRSTSVER